VLGYREMGRRSKQRMSGLVFLILCVWIGRRREFGFEGKKMFE